MHKISKEDVKKLREEMERTRNKNAYRRMQAVALRGEGHRSAEIAGITGFHKQWVGQLCRKYCIGGIRGLLEDGRKGGNNSYMSNEEAKVFLKSFEEAAAKGQIITVQKMAEAFDVATGVKRKSLSTLYKFLHRHGWRTVVPKKYHPGRASEEDMEASKKLTKS